MAEHILHPIHLQELAKGWLLEDTPSYDYAGAVVGTKETEANILVKSPGMLAGIPFVNAILDQVGLKAEWLHSDGDSLQAVTCVAKVRGPANRLLLAERVLLNVLCRASGVATAAFNMCSKLRHVGWKGSLSGTRKTTPGFRMVEKYALLVGGADTHRHDLSQMIMLKDNHIWISGSTAKAIEEVRKVCSFSQKIEVECRSLQEALEAGEARCDIIMLDNFDFQELHETAKQVKTKFPHVLIEASGGVTMENVQQYASPWIDIISSSALVQGYHTLDISMKVNRGITN